MKKIFEKLRPIPKTYLYLDNVRGKARSFLKKYKDHTCRYCGRKASDVILNLDHVQPRSKGGKSTMENLVTACIDCNSGKADMVINISKAKVNGTVFEYERLSDRGSGSDFGGF